VNAALAFDRVTGARGGRVLFEDLSFTLGPGNAALVTGANGSGKSSLVRIGAGLLPPASGHVDRSGDIALLSEATALDPELSLARAVGFWAAIDGHKAAAASALEVVGLAALAAIPVRLLSTGQRRRAAMARVIASGAPIWLLDEPANGLDDGAVATLERVIADHRAAGGIAIVATHSPIDLPDAHPIALGMAE
jgi:heme exporter protein A